MREALSIRKKLVHHIIWTIAYGSLVLGIWPLKYDDVTRKLKRSKWLIGYSLLLYTLLFALTKLVPMDMVSSLEMGLDLFRRNPLTALVSKLQGIFAVFTILVTLLHIWIQSGELKSALNQVLRIKDKKCFKDAHKNELFDVYVIWKGLFIVIQIVSSLAVVFCISPVTKSSQLFIVIFLMVSMQISLLFVTMQFHIAAAHIYRCTWSINGQLLGIANNIANAKHAELRQLLRGYKNILDLTNRFAVIYDYPLMLMMSAFMMANIMSIYFFIVLHISLGKVNSIADYILLGQNFVVNNWDFWLTIAVCERVEYTGRCTSNILRLFNDFKSLESEFKRTLETFALLCSQRRLQFRYCGLFVVNNTSGFQMLVSSIMYLLLLVQFDFMNL